MVNKGKSDAGTKTATLGDVAKIAGVSIATASKALNGRGGVAPSTRQRVLDAADTLSFTPNELARGLIVGRTRTVGLLTSDLEGRFVIPILMGAEDAFGAGKINVFLCDARGDSIREQQHLDALLTRRVDGIIVVGRSTDPRASLGEDLPVPVVYAYAPSRRQSDVSLTPDNVGGGAMAATHLLAIGRRNIAIVTGDPTYAAAQDRTSGAISALEAQGVSLVTPPMASEWSERWGRDATAVILTNHPEVDGIIAGSDQIARGVLDTVRDFGRSVPEDLAVVSFDNWEILARGSRPELSSIDADLQSLGRAAAVHIFDAIEGVEPERGVHYLPGRLVVRGSTVPTR